MCDGTPLQLTALAGWGGRNWNSELGYDDTNSRGDTPGEMGENLPFVILGFTLAPTPGPTANPTNQPSANPPSAPTVSPSENPTAYPSKEPTDNPSRDPTVNPTSDPTLNPSSNPTLDTSNSPSVSPTANPSSKPVVEPSTESQRAEAEVQSECPVTNCDDLREERDQMRLYLWVHYGINAVLVVMLLMMLCKDMRCCRRENNSLFVTGVLPQESDVESNTAKARNILLRSVAVDE